MVAREDMVASGVSSPFLRSFFLMRSNTGGSISPPNAMMASIPMIPPCMYVNDIGGNNYLCKHMGMNNMDLGIKEMDME